MGDKRARTICNPVAFSAGVLSDRNELKFLLAVEVVRLWGGGSDVFFFVFIL
jgi:hypothetical protein